MLSRDSREPFTISSRGTHFLITCYFLITYTGWPEKISIQTKRILSKPEEAWFFAWYSELLEYILSFLSINNCDFFCCISSGHPLFTFWSRDSTSPQPRDPPTHYTHCIQGEGESWHRIHGDFAKLWPSARPSVVPFSSLALTSAWEKSKFQTTIWWS